MTLKRSREPLPPTGTVSHLEPYPGYTDSGVQWLGQIPGQWQVQRIKSLFREKDERSGNADGLLLSLTRARGIVPQTEATTRLAGAADLSKYKVCRTGDLVMNRMQAWSGMFARSSYDGLVSPDYCVFVGRGTMEVKFFEYLFRNPLLVNQFAQRSKGIGSGFNRLYTPDFGDIPIGIPPFPEQVSAVRFLDHADRRIRRYIAAKQKLIKLLEEQKQAIIHRVVTRGVDPNVRLKPSGVEWLGDVPVAWKVLPLRRITISRCDGPFGSGLTSAHYTDDGVRVVRLQNIGHGEFRDDDASFISAEHYGSLGEHSVLPGDVLIAGLGDDHHPAGRACIAPAHIIPAMVKADCFRFRINSRILPDFLALHLTATAKGASAALSTGATRQRVNLQAMAGRAVAIPPVYEQQHIVDYVHAVTGALKSALRVTHRQIISIREYRTRLIADVVTGKVDVRAAAAGLPDDPEEAPLNDEDEADATTDDERENALDVSEGL